MEPLLRVATNWRAQLALLVGQVDGPAAGAPAMASGLDLTCCTAQSRRSLGRKPAVAVLQLLTECAGERGSRQGGGPACLKQPSWWTGWGGREVWGYGRSRA